jgi:ubiquitin carboxyl-terminal hydrolase 5/13
MEKTEKTMAELEHEQNMAFEFDAITEAGAHLDPVFGKGLMGLKNLGNSCYVNSVVQLLWAIPELQERYLQAASEILYSTEGNPAQDFLTQVAS